MPRKQGGSRLRILTMTELSTAQQEIARNNERAILRSLAVVTQKRVSELAGISETKLSRIKDGDLEMFCAVLAALSLKLVPTDVHTVSEAEYLFMAEQMVRRYQAIIEKETENG